LIAEVARLWPDDFVWISPHYEYEMGKMPVNIVTGSDAVRNAVSTGSVLDDLDKLATGDQATWWKQTASIRIYDEVELVPGNRCTVKLFPFELVGKVSQQCLQGPLYLDVIQLFLVVEQ